MFKQFIKFGMVGVVNTVLNYIIYIVCIRFGMHYIAANIIGFLIVIFNAYLLQNKFVFAVKDGEFRQSWWKILLKTYASYAFTGLILTNILSWLWIEVLDLSVLLRYVYIYTEYFFAWGSGTEFAEYCAPFLNCMIMVPVNFMINKFWTYR